MIDYLQEAINEATMGLKRNEGGPFGAVIVSNGEIVAQGHNEVLKSNDPTAHAEIVAIRKASQKLGRFDLSDCEIYSSCEPCPMCLAAIHWAKMTKCYFGCTRKDAAEIGFDDEFIYDVIKGTADKKQVEMMQQEREECLKLFAIWQDKRDKVGY